MSRQATSADTRSAISSPGSEGGRSPSDGPGSSTSRESGPAPVRVSRFRARDSAKAMSTNATSGPLFTASSPSARLQSSLESRLRARMGVSGSPEYVLTWKTWDMPAGPPICALRASARPISGSGFSGWPTPTVNDAKDSQYAYSRGNHDAVVLKLPGQARLALGLTLERSFACPTQMGNAAGGALRLNPKFSLWLQGYPATWADCAAPVTRSSRKSRLSSSAPGSRCDD